MVDTIPKAIVLVLTVSVAAAVCGVVLSLVIDWIADKFD